MTPSKSMDGVIPQEDMPPAEPPEQTPQYKRLQELDELRLEGKIGEEEYQANRKRILTTIRVKT